MIIDGLRFEFRIVDGDGDTLVEDWTPVCTIDEFGGCEMVELHVSSALRAVRRDMNRRDAMEPAE